VTARNGRRQGRPEVPGASPNHTLMVGGMVQCRRCACLLPDTKPARDQHDNYHAALRRLWDRRPVMSAEDLVARVARLEADRDRLVELVCHLTAAVELLAQVAGANVPVQQEPTRTALRLIRGGADPGARAL
jgi:hypothetical protein